LGNKSTSPEASILIKLWRLRPCRRMLSRRIKTVIDKKIGRKLLTVAADAEPMEVKSRSV